jgi:transketolase
MANSISELKKLAVKTREYILKSTTAAGTGHPSSSLSATDLMVAMMFGGFFKADLDDTKNPENDRLIFSKGHTSPLFYSLYATAGKVSEEELMTLRKFGSRLEGHPTVEFPYTEVATGSLGQGLGVGVGYAIDAKMQAGNWQNQPKLSKKLREYRTFVLLGDSEMAEGSVWEAMQLAAHYKLDNLVAVLDANRLGQRGETMYGHDVADYQLKAESFGWKTLVIDGHDMEEIVEAYKKITAKVATYTIVESSLENHKFESLADFGEVETVDFSEHFGEIIELTTTLEKEKDLIKFLETHLKPNQTWYSDSMSTTKKVVFYGKTFHIEDLQDIQKAKEYGLSINIPAEQLDFDIYNSRPTMIIARTIKGKGVDFMEDKDGWHGKAVPADKLQEALKSVEKMGL